MTPSVCRIESVSMVYQDGESEVRAVDSVTLSVEAGESVGLVGPSGSGKTTLLSIAGMLRTPTEGVVYFQGEKVERLNHDERKKLRLKKVGFVFQQLRLIPTFTALENVELPLVLGGVGRSERHRRAMEILDKVGLSGLAARRPQKLSLGEQQRVAVARALVTGPALILADEPTSQLDSVTGQGVVDLIEFLRKESGAAVILSTHDPVMAQGMGRVLNMRNGKVS